MPPMMKHMLTLFFFFEKAVFVLKLVGRVPPCSKSLKTHAARNDHRGILLFVPAGCGRGRGAGLVPGPGALAGAGRRCGYRSAVINPQFHLAQSQNLAGFENAFRDFFAADE